VITAGKTAANKNLQNTTFETKKSPSTGLERVRTMSTNSRKAEPQAGNLGRGQYGALSEAPFRTPATYPTVVIVPQNAVKCQEITTFQTRAILALADNVLAKYNRARAAYLVGGDPGDYLTAQALADDRRALLQEIGGELPF